MVSEGRLAHYPIGVSGVVGTVKSRCLATTFHRVGDSAWSAFTHLNSSLVHLNHESPRQAGLTNSFRSQVPPETWVAHYCG